MPSHTETRIVPYSAEQLFDLVMDIEKYPEFLPWCVGARINKRGKSNLEADVVIGYKMFREKFSSRVHFSHPKKIEVEYMQGPMRQLSNVWSFKDIKQGQCRVDFYVDFTMRSRLFEKLVDQFFQHVLARMIDSFEARAVHIYGRRNSS